MGGAIDNSPDNRMEPAAPDVAPLLADYFWRTNQATGFREHVRRSDGLVVHRERLSNRTSQEAGRMREATKERVKMLIGERSGTLEIIALAGQHPTSQAVMVTVRCDCGVELGPFLAYDITGHRKKSHLNCPLKESKSKGKRRRLRLGNGMTKGRKGKPKPAPGVENVNGSVPDLDIRLRGSSADFRAEMMEEARVLRRAAVSILKGIDPVVIADAMRRQADRLDELVYDE